MANEGEDNLSINFSKLKGKFKRDREAGDEMALDLSSAGKWLKSHKNIIIYGLLILLLLFSGRLLFTPESKYTGIHENSLSAMDPYWHYRHAQNVYDHGYVGDTKVCYNEKLNEAIPNTPDCPPGYNMVAWDTMHDAPFGSRAYQEFYPYFSAYSYKAVGRFFAPSLIVWHRWTPAIFGVLAVLGMFLLVKQLFGPYAGLASGFVLSLSPSFITRSVSGFADSDALIAVFTIFTFYFFAKAWDSESFIYSLIGGVCLGLFGIAWNAYKFAPILMLGLAGFYFAFNILKKYFSAKESPVVLVKEHFSENWKKYLCLAIILFLGLFLIGFVRGFHSVNVFSAISASTGLKVTEVIDTSIEGEAVRNVYKTVSEMNPANLRQIISRLHFAPVLLALSFVLLLPIGLWKKMKTHVHHLAFFSLWLASALFMSFKATRFTTMMVLPLAIFAGISLSFSASKITAKKPVVSVIIGLSLFLLIFALPNVAVVKGAVSGPSFYTTGKLSAEQSGPSLGQNWFDFFSWARDETPKDAIFASWWDPGHAMTAVGERPAVADGSQNSRHVHDLAIAFTTTEESVALERLKKYNVSYFYTSSDLISKYGAISFLASGRGENYLFLSRSEVKNTASGTVLIYPIDASTSILLNLQEGGISASIKQGYNSQPIKRIFYFNEGQAFVAESQEEAAINGLLYVDQSFRSAIFLPEHLENNMLTQLHMFNGQQLEHFEFIQNYGEEIKVFKVNYG